MTRLRVHLARWMEMGNGLVFSLVFWSIKVEERKQTKDYYFYPNYHFSSCQNGSKIGEKPSYIGDLTVL